MEAQSWGLEKTGSRGWRPRLREQIVCRSWLLGDQRTVAPCPAYKGRRVLYKPLGPCRRLQVSSRSKGTGKRRKEGALSPMPKDKADHPDLLGKGDGQSRATMVTNLQESREWPGQRSAPGGVNPAACQRGKKLCVPSLWQNRVFRAFPGPRGWADGNGRGRSSPLASRGPAGLCSFNITAVS